MVYAIGCFCVEYRSELHHESTRLERVITKTEQKIPAACRRHSSALLSQCPSCRIHHPVPIRTGTPLDNEMVPAAGATDRIRAGISSFASGRLTRSSSPWRQTHESTSPGGVAYEELLLHQSSAILAMSGLYFIEEQPRPAHRNLHCWIKQAECLTRVDKPYKT